MKSSNLIQIIIQKRNKDKMIFKAKAKTLAKIANHLKIVDMREVIGKIAPDSKHITLY